MTIPSELRKLVKDRAKNRCEYCGLAQEGQEASFHIDHVIPISGGGPTHSDNLALSCVSCSLRKGAREFAEDPRTGKVVRLFHPRVDLWKDHFLWEGSSILSLTPKGRATISALQLNREIAIAIRNEETHFGRHPPV